MATETITRITDDLDGTEGATTYTFTLGGLNYEVDLTEANYQKLVQALNPFITAGRPADKDPIPRLQAKRAARRRASTLNLADVRQWAKDNGFKVSERGRIAEDVQKAYQDAH